MGLTSSCCNQPPGATDAVLDDIPLDAKAIFPILATKNGADLTPGNTNLQMLLTSAGLMPETTKGVVQRYKELSGQVKGKGVLYLLDAKLKTLQWQDHGGAGDPEKHNDQKYVSYKREPDAPGGKPAFKDGKLLMKSQAELSTIGYSSIEYALKNNQHYSNGHLSVLAQASVGEKVPVYLSYFGFDGDLTKSGKPEYKILMAQGFWQDGEFTMLRSDGQTPFSKDDYEAKPKYVQDGSISFKPVKDEEFAKVVNSVNTVWSCGGVTWSTVMALQPYFVDDGKVLDVVNPYGKAILDAVKSGTVVYVGQSAGTVALSYNIGPLTTDPTDFQLETDNGHMEEMDLDFELGKKMLKPGLGEYIGIPHRLIFRPHLHFDYDKLRFGGRAVAAQRLAEDLTDISAHDIYCITCSDYDFHAGKGDCVEISAGGVTYHVGHSDKTHPLSENARNAIKEHSKRHGWSWDKDYLAAQPGKNPPEGRSFKWEPSQGEVHAAGPKSQKPFRIYASSDGLLAHSPHHGES